jgi:uncharacterized membrane protein
VLVSASVAVLVMSVGVLAVLRAAFIVTVKGRARFRTDPWSSLVVGFTLILLGQYLFTRWP